MAFFARGQVLRSSASSPQIFQSSQAWMICPIWPSAAAKPERALPSGSNLPESESPPASSME